MINNKAARIKLSVYMIILLLFTNLFSLFSAFQTTQVYAAGLPELGGKTPKEWYDIWKGEIKFVGERQLLAFVNKSRAASSINVIRFSTIGWQVRFEPTDGSTKYMTWIQPYEAGTEEKVDGMMYTPYVIPISPSSNQQYSGSIIESLMKDFGGTVTQDYLSTKFAKGVNIYFDSIMSIKEAGSTEPNAIMTADRKIVPNNNAPAENRGEYYLTKNGTSLGANCTVKSGLPKVTSWDSAKGGIRGARGWGDPNMFEDYYNKKVQFKKEDVILQKTVKFTCWSTTGEKLDPEGKPMIWGLYDIKPGETVPVTVTGLSFPGYKIHHSAINYTGRGGADDVDIVTGDQAITRTINLTTDHENHYVYFYYEPIEGGGGSFSGSIIFEPNQSADIPGNNDNWVNQNIPVKVTIEPSKEQVAMTSFESRGYKYYDSCYSIDPETGDCEGKWVSSSTLCPFRQTWVATELYVTGQGKTAQGSTVSLGPFTIPNGGTITIDKELKDVQLSAKVSKWTPQNDRTFIGGPPPRGSWTQSTPSRDTPAPTEDYESDSGLYYIDKTSPYSASFSWDYRDYIDENLTVTVTVGDNLSGVVETRYVLNNSPYDTSGMHSVSASTADGTEDYDSFTVQITQPGSWWIHVYQRDRAGNVTYTTSEEYKIIRLGTPINTSGSTFTGQSDKFWISPLQMNYKIPRATRFDTLLQTYGLTEAETNYTTVHLTVPNWVDDEIEKKVNGKYAVTDGTTDTHTMEYYSGHNQGPQNYATPSTILQWWKAYIAPYGTPVTLDKNGGRLRNQYEFKVQLVYDNYYPNKTHVSTIKFDIIPETKVKTEIIKNEY